MVDSFNNDFVCANKYLDANDYIAAHAIYKSILSVQPDNTRALHALGVVTFRGFGNARLAVRLIRQSLAIKNDFSDAYNSLAKIFQGCRRIQAAIYCYLRAVDTDTKNHIAWINLGTIYHFQKKTDEAFAAFQDAVRLAPDNFDAIYGVARALVEMKRYQEALDFFAKAQVLSPGNATVYYGIALANKQLGNFSMAKTNLLQALDLKPDYCEAYQGLASVLLSLGEAGVAVETIRKALALKPDFRDAYSFLLFALHYPSSTTQKDLYEATVDFCERFFNNVPRYKFHNNDRSPDRRLRIGYISGEFNRHPVGFFFEHSLAYHDPEIITTFCYSNGPYEDWMTERLKSYSCNWRNIAGVSAETVSRHIQKDEIDILVDLSGHTGHGRPDVMARKPAPVQVSWIGYYNTSGLDTLDYIIMDRDTLPPTLVRWFTEQVVYLPETRFCYTPPSDSIVVKTLPAFQKHHITFGCFNNISKISPDTIAVWSEILTKIPDALLILKWGSFSDAAVLERYKALFQSHGIGADRVEYRGYSDYGTLLEQYGDIDIALDPFPFSGATTTCEALWMGVPVITLPGSLPAGRQTLALLKVIGLPEFVANSKESYIELAIRFASNLERLSEIRQKLRTMMANSPLCDGQRFTTELMTAYRVMWQRWCQGDMKNIDRKPIEITPAVPEAVYNRGVTCLAKKQWHEAKRFFEQAIVANPAFPEAYNNLGIVYFHLGELASAQVALEKAVSLRTDFVDALNNLGRVLTDRNKSSEALKLINKVLQLVPDHHQAWCHLGMLHQNAGRISKACTCFRKSIKLCSDFVEAHVHLATLYMKYNSDKGCHLLQSLAVKYPDNVEVHTHLAYAMHYNNLFLRESIFQEISYISDTFYKENPPKPAVQLIDRHMEDIQLRIGYVSADFRQHPGGVFFQAIALHYDRSQFAITCYDTSDKQDDIITDNIMRHVDCFRRVAGTTDDELITLIQEDMIDILVDLAGFTAGNRLSVFAKKPAPVQASWLGWFNTTGIKAIDYIIVDPLMVQPGEEQYFAEKPVYLPESRFCYTPPFLCPDVDELPATANNYVTFGCFNNISKITDQVVSAWAAILQHVPQSRLILKSQYFKDYEMRKYFIKRFEACGVSRDRLELRPDSLHFFMLSEYGDIDIALDPFPYCGGLTSCESLWMGVPVITLPGELPVSRQTESFLKAIGLSNFVARSKDEYIYIACEAAANMELLVDVRSSLREKMSQSSLCDGEKFAADFGNVLHKIWNERVAGVV